MALRTSKAVWEGNLVEGKGTMTLGEGVFEGPYSFKSRFEEGDGTNPEELIAAAHAGCYSMAVSNAFAKAGFPPTRVHTTAKVHLTKDPAGGFKISKIDLVMEGDVPGIDAETFQEKAQEAKRNCPVSKLVTGAEITLTATLLS